MSGSDAKHLSVNVSWEEVKRVVEENGYIIFPKDVLMKYAKERSKCPHCSPISLASDN